MNLSPSLLSLPQEIFHKTLQYLYFNDLSYLDQAIVNHIQRPIYLEKLRGLILLPGSLLLNSSDEEGGQEEEDQGEDKCYFHVSECLWLLQREVYPTWIRIMDSSSTLHDLLLKSLPYLQTLEIHTKLNSFRELLKIIPNLKTFRDFQGIPETLLLKFLENNRQVEEIKLADGRYSGKVSFALAKCHDLKNVDISGNKWVTDVTLPPLAGAVNLTSLNFYGTNVKKLETIQFFEQSLPNLRHMMPPKVFRTKEFFRKYVLPSFDSPDLETQLIGLRYLSGDEEEEGVESIFKSLKLYDRVMQYLSSPSKMARSLSMTFFRNCSTAIKDKYFPRILDSAMQHPMYTDLGLLLFDCYREKELLEPSQVSFMLSCFPYIDSLGFETSSKYLDRIFGLILTYVRLFPQHVFDSNILKLLQETSQVNAYVYIFYLNLIRVAVSEERLEIIQHLLEHAKILEYLLYRPRVSYVCRELNQEMPSCIVVKCVQKILQMDPGNVQYLPDDLAMDLRVEVMKEVEGNINLGEKISGKGQNIVFRTLAWE